MNEFEFRPDRTTDYGVSCPWASKKYPYRPYNGENGVSTFSVLFLIGSFWYFHVTRTSIKAWMSLNVLKWDLNLAHWTQGSDCCPLGYLFFFVKSLQCQLLQSLWLIWIMFGMNGYKILKCFGKEQRVSSELPCPATGLIKLAAIDHSDEAFLLTSKFWP